MGFARKYLNLLDLNDEGNRQIFRVIPEAIYDYRLQINQEYVT